MNETCLVGDVIFHLTLTLKLSFKPRKLSLKLNLGHKTKNTF